MSDRRDHQLSPADQVLKRATKQLVRAFGGTEAAAEQLGQAEHRSRVDHRRMSDVGNPNHAAFLRIDEAAELEELTVGQPGWPYLTRVLAARTGHALVKLPDAPLDDTEWAQRAAKLLSEVGDVIAGLGARIHGGGVDRDQWAGLMPDVEEALEAVLEVREAVRRQMTAEK